VVFLVAGLLVGCSVTAPRRLVIGPIDRPPERMFEAAERVVRGGGRTVVAASFDEGRIVTEIRSLRDRRDRYGMALYTFELQFLRGGWLRLRPRGPRFEGEGPSLRLPEPVRAEMMGLALDLGRLRGLDSPGSVSAATEPGWAQPESAWPLGMRNPRVRSEASYGLVTGGSIALGAGALLGGYGAAIATDALEGTEPGALIVAGIVSATVGAILVIVGLVHPREEVVWEL